MRIVAKINLSIVVVLVLCLLLGGALTWSAGSKIRDELNRLFDESGRYLAASMGTEAGQYVTFFEYDKIQQMLTSRVQADPRILYAAVEFGAGLREKREAGSPKAGPFREYSFSLADNKSAPAQVTLHYSTRALEENVTSLMRGTLLGLALSLLLLIAALWGLVVYLVNRPLVKLVDHARAVAGGNLGSQVRVATTDEFGHLGDDLSRMTGNLREMALNLRGTFGGLEKVSGDLAKVAGDISQGAVRQADSLAEVSSSMEEMSATIRTVAGSVEEMTHSSEENASAVLEIASSVEEVAKNAQILSSASDQASSATSQMDVSIQEVARNVEHLSGLLAEVTSSLTEVDASIKLVEENASASFQISSEVSRIVSEEGEQSAAKAMSGIEEIKKSVEGASEIIRTLGKRSNDIGKIVDLINEVNEQTNLLSLNAAIIAAQAGEHGRAFAVVASEIRELSDKTAGSTKEIGNLIATLQKESRHAIKAMEEGVRAVEGGVRLVGEVKVTLRRAAEGSVNASQASKGIAVSTAEQARAIMAITGNSQRISEMSQEIARATKEQSEGSRQVMAAAVKIREQAAQVERTTREQSKGISGIGAASEKGMGMAQGIMRATQEERKSSEFIVKNIQNIQGITTQNMDGVARLNEMVQQLAEQASLLKKEIDRFRTG